jgi:branched-subunit amino acid ABC-type transport system permease component
MTASLSLVQVLGGLSYASTLFLMAAGLTLIFGVTRIVNFAHGSFFMLGALFTAHWVTNWFPAWGDSAGLYLLAMLMGAVWRRWWAGWPRCCCCAAWWACPSCTNWWPLLA